MSSPPAEGTIGAGRRQSSTALGRIALAARAVADADPAEIESTARQLGESRRYLAPVAWGAGAMVLLVRGVKLLLLNWRLTLIELVPAVWVWLVMWDLRRHTLRGDAFRDITVRGMIVLALITVAASIASFWCNTVFAFAITQPQPRIAPAVRQAGRYLAGIVCAGAGMGVILAIGAVVVPRIDAFWLYLIAIGALYSLMLISFVVVPAHPRREEAEATAQTGDRALDGRRRVERRCDDPRVPARPRGPAPSRAASPARARVRTALDRDCSLRRRHVLGQGREAEHEARHTRLSRTARNGASSEGVRSAELRNGASSEERAGLPGNAGQGLRGLQFLQGPATSRRSKITKDAISGTAT
jgi:hypothetical protein